MMLLLIRSPLAAHLGLHSLDGFVFVRTVIVAPFTSFPQPAPAFEVDLVECKPSSLRASPLGLMLSDVLSIYQRNTKMASSELLSFSERGWGPPLLLVHGLMFTGEMFEPVVEHFATRHRVIVPDLRGHGRSGGLAPPYTVAQLAADLSRLLDHLGIDSTAVLGYSHGGAIAQQLVLDHPTRCNRLVLACTYAFNLATFRERLEGHLLPLLLDVAGMRRFAKFVVSQGLKQLKKQRADWVVGLIASRDRKLMVRRNDSDMRRTPKRRKSPDYSINGKEGLFKT
jgi:pimeloyl-ACP methyl ester carboxylesterase